MKTKIPFLLLCVIQLLCTHKAYACYTYNIEETYVVIKPSGTISCSQYGCWSNSSNIWLVEVGDSSARVRLEYDISMPVYPGNRLRIWQATEEHKGFGCIGNPSCLILDTDDPNMNYGGYGGYSSGVLITDSGGAFAVQYDLTYAGSYVYSGLHINFSGGEMIASNLHVSGAITATDLQVSGNVGIGVSNPQYPLHVNGTITASKLKTDTISNYGSMYTNEIGVGLVNSPQAPLHVLNTDNTSTNRVVGIYEGNSINSLPNVQHRNNLVFRDTGGSTSSAMVFHDGLSSEPFTGLSSAQNWWERRANTDEQKWGYGATTRMILKDGNLGIGIGDTIPSERLHVAGNVKADTIKASNLQLNGNAKVDTIKAKGIQIEDGFNVGNALNFVEGGTINPSAAMPLNIYKHNVLPAQKDSTRCIVTFSGKGQNIFKNSLWLRRDTSGSSEWLTTRLHDGISVDGSFLEPGVDTKTWWERDPYDNIQSWGNGSTTYMTLKGDKLGLGIDNPGEKLVLYNNTNIQTASQYLNSNTGTSNGFIVGIEQAGNGLILHRDNTYIRFGTNATEQMRILANGNVGIGTFSDPSTAINEKLVVDGTIKANIFSADKAVVYGTIEAKKITITESPVADFVFAPDYNLPKLETVEAHIKEKQHLPEIPSAAEMIENGVDIAELNIKLLQKIEELTLYVIDQNKRLSEQSEQIINQNKQLSVQNEQIVNQNQRISTLEKALEEK